MGFNVCRHGMLCNERLRRRSVSALMYDWLHVYMSDGIVTIEIGAFLDTLSTSPLSNLDINEFVKQFKYPESLKASAATHYFEKKRKRGDQDFKGSASHALSLLPVLKVFILTQVLPFTTDCLEAARRLFLQLCVV